MTEAPRPSSPASSVPRWVRGSSNLFAMLVAAVLAGAALFLVSWLSPVLAPFGLGLFLAALAAPLFRRLEGRGASPAVALGLTVALVVAVGLAIVWLFLASGQALGASLSRYAEELQAQSSEGGATGVSSVILSLVSPAALVDVLSWIVGVCVQIGGNLAFAVVISALLLLDAPRLSTLATAGLGSGNPVFRELPTIAQAAVTYLVVRIRVNLVTAGGLLVIMLALGVDYALLWSVGAFFLSFVPYLGLTLALVAPTILALAESGPAAAGVVVLGGIALNLLAENVLEPTLTGRALSLATWLVFAMFFFWVWLIGPVGALLSMPITVLIVAVLGHNEQTRWLATLLTRRGETQA